MSSLSSAASAIIIKECVRTNCFKPQRIRSPYCSNSCRQNRANPKRIRSKQVHHCVECGSELNTKRKYCDDDCKASFTADTRANSLEKNSFLKFVINTCKRSGTVEIVPITESGVKSLYDVWSDRKRMNGFKIKADGSYDKDSITYALCHLSAANTKTHVGLLHADNLVIGLASQNASDGNRQSVHNGMCLRRDKLKDVFKVSNDNTLSDHNEVLKLAYRYSPALKAFAKRRTETIGDDGTVRKGWLLKRPSPRPKLIQNGSKFYYETNGKEHVGRREEPWDASQVLKSEFTRMGHSHHLFDFSYPSQRKLAFKHLMWTAKVERDEQSILDFDLETDYGYDFESDDVFHEVGDW